MQRVCRLRHVKHLILNIFDTQLGVQPTLHPHLVDLVEKNVHICLQQSMTWHQLNNLMWAMLVQSSDHVVLLMFDVLGAVLNG